MIRDTGDLLAVPPEAQSDTDPEDEEDHQALSGGDGTDLADVYSQPGDVVEEDLG